MKVKFGTVSTAVVLALALVVGASATASAKSSSTPAQDAAKAKRAMQPFLKIPTTLNPVTTKLPAAAPTGKTIVNLVCDNSSCTLDDNAIKAASAPLGWTVKSVPFKLADPSTLLLAFDSALAFKPLFVTLTGVPVETWTSEIPKYKAAGVGIVANNVGSVEGAVKVDSTLLGYSNGPDYMKTGSVMLADWFIQDSGGTGHAMIMNYPGVGTSTGLTREFGKFVKAHCSKCTVDSVDLTLAQLASGASPAATVSAIQAKPAINYVISPTSSAVNGMRAALDVIGRKDVKIAGNQGAYPNYLNIASGAEAAWTNAGKSAGGYQFIDIALHGLAGPKYQYKTDQFVPLMLVTKDNLATLGGPEAAKTFGSFNVPSNYADLYTALRQGK